METYMILAIGVVGYIAYRQYHVNINSVETSDIKNVSSAGYPPTGTHKFKTQVMPGPNVSFMNSTY